VFVVSWFYKFTAFLKFLNFYAAGTPCDLVNVRLQNDMKIPLDQRRNYKNVFHGLYRIARYEG